MRTAVIFGGAAALWPYGLAIGAVVAACWWWCGRRDNRVFVVRPGAADAGDAPLTLVHLPRDRRRRA